DPAGREAGGRRIRRYSAGLAPAVTPSNTLVMYSTALGSVLSTARTDHGLFVTELLREIRAPGTTAEQAFRNTQAGVIAATNREQVPWLSSSMTTDFSFFGGPAPTPTPGPGPDRNQNPGTRQKPRPPAAPAPPPGPPGLLPRTPAAPAARGGAPQQPKEGEIPPPHPGRCQRPHRLLQARAALCDQGRLRARLEG